MRDPRTGRYFASVTSGFYGPRVFFIDGDPTGEWTMSDGPVIPEETEWSVERIWMIKPGEAPGQIWAGVAHAALFESRDDGATWALNDALWKERVAGDWQPGAGGLALHSICPWPGDPQRMAIGVSAAGVWITEDGGKSWRTGYSGMVPGYVPEDQTEETNVLCVHNMHRAPTQPERLFLQFHGSVYRSDDEGGSWNDIHEGLPSGFGFPLAVDPADPDSAFVIPLVADVDRVTPDGKVRVFETRDAGAPGSNARRACRARTPTSPSTGRRSAARGRCRPAALLRRHQRRVFGSADAGASWSSATSGSRRSPACGSRSGVPARTRRTRA